MKRVKYRWKGHRGMIQPGWQSKVLTDREAEIDALTKRLDGHDVVVEDVAFVQTELFKGAA